MGIAQSCNNFYRVNKEPEDWIGSSVFFDKVLPYGIEYINIPQIEHKDSFVNSNKIINGIRPNDMSHYVMRGQDQYNRLYLVIYYMGNIQVFFQKYTFDDKFWTYGTYHGNNRYELIVYNGMDSNLLDRDNILVKIRNIIQLLIKHNEIKKIDYYKYLRISV